MKKFLAILLMASLLLVAVLPVGALAESKTTVYRVKTNGGNLNMRSGAGTKYAVTGSLKNGTAFTVQKKSGNWYKIKTLKAGKVGWISKNYTTTRAYALVATNQKGLNIRKGPGTGYAILGSSPKGAKILVKYIQGNWAYVTYSGVSGWSSRSWLKWVA